MILRSLILFALCLTAQATDYYVRSDGNDGNTGTADTAGGAWLTIQHAASTIVAGDTVHIKDATFNEFVTPANSGTAGNPIVFDGTRSGTNIVTIIDPSTAMSTGWIAAPEVGTGVYKFTNATFRACEMTIDGKRVGFASDTGDIQTFIDSAYSATGLTTGLQLLTVDTAQSYYSPINAVTLSFWDGIEALYVSTQSASAPYTNYLRLRDGSDPNGLNIRVAPRQNTGYSVGGYSPCFNVDTKSYITFRNLRVQGANAGFSLIRGDHIIVENCHLVGGWARIYGGLLTNCIIRSNYFTTYWYGGTNVMGAWGGGDTVPYHKALNTYLCGKFLMGRSSQYDYGIFLTLNCVTNSIYGNTFENTLNDVFNLEDTVNETTISSNVIRNAGAHGMMFLWSMTNNYVFDNLFENCNINWRFERVDQVGETLRILYLYRNRLQLPSSVGDQIYLHVGNDGGNGTNKFFWLYQNSFSGGRDVLQISPEIGDPATGIGGLPDFHFLNNICSSNKFYWPQGSWGVVTNDWVIGEYDYNVVTPPWETFPTAADPAWFMAHNIKAATNFWVNASGMSFALSAGSVAIDAGKNLPVTNPTLPQDGTVKVGAGWDIGALEFGNPGAVIIRNIVGRNLRINYVAP